MGKSLNFITTFFHWLFLLIKKWVWVIGLPLPLLDVLSTYLPNFPQITIPWQISVVVSACGIVLSAFLVYRDQKIQLSSLLNNAPEYSLQVLNLSQTICKGDKIHIECNVRFLCKSVWLGVLDNISLEVRMLPGFLGHGEITNKSYQPLDWHCPNLLKLPYDIPQNGVDIGLEIHYPYKEEMALEPQMIPKRAKINLCFLIGFHNPMTGYMQKSERLELPLDIKSFPKLIRQHQEEIRRKE